MAARINDVCDAVVAAVLAAWTGSASPPGADDAVERTYLVPVELGGLVGRKVWVTPASFADENADRGSDLGIYGVALVVAERYAGAEERPPRAWLDERVAFVELLFDTLKDFKPKRNPLAVGGMRLWTQTAAVGEVYGFEFLSQQHAFWAELEFEFRGIN